MEVNRTELSPSVRVPCSFTFNDLTLRVREYWEGGSLHQIIHDNLTKEPLLKEMLSI
jgi:hypothetical protein